MTVFRACSVNATTKSFVDAGGDHHPGRCRAVLATVEVAGDRNRRRRRFDVGVVENDDRGLPTQFQMYPLHIGCGGLGNLDTGPDAPGDGDHRGCGVRNQRRAGVPTTGDNVQDARRQEFRGQFRQQKCGHRRGVTGFTTMVLPAASAGPIFQIAIISG